MENQTSENHSIDTGLACFAIMANFFEKPISLNQIKHKYDRQNSHFEEYELLQLAKEFSFKAKFVETAKPIMKLVPEDYKLEAEVQILNKDIGFVRPAQDVEIKIDSFPFTKYGTIKGKVCNISGDAIQDEKLGLVFNARLTLSDNKIKADGQIVQLKPGMSVTAEIKTGKRRVIEYLLSPVMKYLNESMRER